MLPMERETALQMAERHVIEGAEAIRHQRDLVARLRADGRWPDAASADALLQTFEEVQEQRPAHLEQISGA